MSKIKAEWTTEMLVRLSIASSMAVFTLTQSALSAPTSSLQAAAGLGASLLTVVPGPPPAGYLPPLPASCNAYLPASISPPLQAYPTLISLHQTVDGHIGSVAVYRSSGDAALDNAVVACASGHTRRPITINGVPADVTAVIAYYWGHRGPSFSTPGPDGKLNICTQPEGLGPAEVLGQAGRSIVAFHIATDGSTKDFAIQQTSNSSYLDDASIKCVQQFHYIPVTQNGRPVEVDHAVALTWTAWLRPWRVAIRELQ